MTGQRFAVLDGMRGIAALAVLWWHAGYGFGAADYPRHGYLAVDFFFGLSGFVLAHAYARAIADGLGFWDFARRRLVRLYPMILAGGVLGAVAFCPGWDGGAAKLFWFNASSFLLLPFGLAFGAGSFPVNIPIWSLFFEFCANAVFWVAYRRQGRAARGVVLWAVAVVLLGAIAHLAGGLRNVGVSSVVAFLAGFPRVAVSFTAGVLIYRHGLHERLPRLPDVCAALALAGLLAVPDCGWWYDMMCVVAVFPLLLCLGAQARETKALHPLWYGAGALSYPLYVIHEPVLRAVYRLQGGALAAMGLAVLLAWALLRFYDAPVRRWLGRAAAY